MRDFQSACPHTLSIRPSITYEDEVQLSELEDRFLMALDLCEAFFCTHCARAQEMKLGQAIELLTPLLAGTTLWFTFIDRHDGRVQRLRSQLQAMLGSSQPGQSCCTSQQHDCPTLCQPIEHAHLLLALLSV